MVHYVVKQERRDMHFLSFVALSDDAYRSPHQRVDGLDCCAIDARARCVKILRRGPC